MADTARQAQLDELQRAASSLGPRALAVLLDMARRLELGTQYGDFDAQKDWAREAIEEFVDGAVYLLIAMHAASTPRHCPPANGK